MSWQPIETAPKDGTQFLAMLSNGWFDLLRAPPAYSGAWPKGWPYLNWSGRQSPPMEETHPPETDWSTTVRATHWQPLPPPPGEG